MPTFEDEIAKAARSIDPRTARMEWWYAEVMDPYGLEEVPAEYSCVGRQYFLAEPEANTAVLVRDVRRLHADIPDAEWEELMRAAAARDDSYDPFRFFHAYR
jgi:hypothetical protein